MPTNRRPSPAMFQAEAVELIRTSGKPIPKTIRASGIAGQMPCNGDDSAVTDLPAVHQYQPNVVAQFIGQKAS